MPYQVAIRLLEKVHLLPVLLMVASSLSRDRLVLNGQFMLFDRKTYEEIGGHSLLKNTVAEDLDFAGYFSRTNYRVEFLFAANLLSCRMYDNYKSLSNGISKMILRLLSGDVVDAIFLSIRFFLYSLFSVAAGIIFLTETARMYSTPELAIITAVPILLISLATGFALYFRIFFLYGLLIPLGWLYQPVFFSIPSGGNSESIMIGEEEGCMRVSSRTIGKSILTYLFVFRMRFDKLAEVACRHFPDFIFQERTPSKQDPRSTQCHATPFPQIKMICMAENFSVLKFKGSIDDIEHLPAAAGKSIGSFPMATSFLAVRLCITKSELQIFTV
ncbi:MAG: glycosyltransferase [Chitinophagales bacterium]